MYICITVKHTLPLLYCCYSTVLYSPAARRADSMCCVCVCIGMGTVCVCAGFTFYIPVRLSHDAPVLPYVRDCICTAYVADMSYADIQCLYTHTYLILTLYYIHVYITLCSLCVCVEA